MGAEPWSCFTPYREEIEEALRESQLREFEAGNYRKPWGFEGTNSTIVEAAQGAGESGTSSVLDMLGVAESPRNPDFQFGAGEFQMFDFDGDPMFCLVAPLAPGQIVELFGTERPTRAMIEANGDFYEMIDRGLGIDLIAYEGDSPAEIFFAGYSFD